MSSPRARPLYLRGDGLDPVFAMLHMPAEQAQREVAVLICPPFGWDDICSYRSRRDWAERLAGCGYPTLRIDLPGTGDSAGSLEDPGRLAAWTRAVGSAASWLSATTGRPRTAAIGIGVGGLLSICAVADGAPIDELVLWAVPSRGRAFIRELRAFGKMEASRFAAPSGLEQDAPPDGSTSAGGFLLSPETTAELEALDITNLSFPPGRVSRAILLERDGIGVDTRLRRHLEESGAAVTVAPGNGYTAMMAEPQDAIAPTGVFTAVEAWLEKTSSPRETSSDGLSRPGPTSAQLALAPAPAPAPARAAPAARRRVVVADDTAVLTVAGVRISETPIVIEQPFGAMFGVLAEPLDTPQLDLGAIFLNAGAIRRVGPNRMWVDASRRWAARGVPSLRLDLEGLGDSEGEAPSFADLGELYVPELIDRARVAIDHLQDHSELHQFVLAGLCSGAYGSFHGALRDERAVAAFMLNPRTLLWDASQNTLRELRRGLLKPSSWRIILRGYVHPRRIRGLARQVPRAVLERARSGRRERGGDDELARALDALHRAEKRLLFIFSEDEPLHDQLQREGRLGQGERWPNLQLELIPGSDHTLRPLYSQRRAHEALDAGLAGELAAASARASSPENGRTALAGTAGSARAADRETP